MDIKSFFGFESTAEKIAMKQYASSIKKVCIFELILTFKCVEIKLKFQYVSSVITFIV